MYWNRPWTINYNGGVLRFTPQGEVEQLVILETSNVTTQQHENGATFSGPTTDGRQAWISVNRSGVIIAGGFHGTTQDSYLRCGASKLEAQVLPPQTVNLICEVRLAPINPGNLPESTITYPSALVNTAAYPYSSIIMGQGSPVNSDSDGALVRSGNSFITKGPGPNEVTVIATAGPSAINAPVYTISGGRMTKAIQNARFSFNLGTTCLPR